MEKTGGLSYIWIEIGSCLGDLVSKFENFRDLRWGSNKKYKMSDFVLSAFSLFLLNNSSFLEQQRLVKSRRGSSNCETLFGLTHIPSDGAIRDNLDYVPASEVLACYGTVYEKMKRMGVFSRYEYGDLGFLVSLDGTQTIDSERICCDKCNKRTLKNGNIQYYHSCVQAVLSHPLEQEIIPLEPEFIEAQTDCEKQDCEINASKRWLEKYLDTWKTRLDSRPITFLGDDLYAHEPFCNLLISKGQHFIFVCKPGSHKALYEELRLLGESGMLSSHSCIQKEGKKNLRYEYKFMNQLPIREATTQKDSPLHVNWVEVTVFDGQNKEVYHNCFISDFLITHQNVEYIAQAGRSRWKIENQAFNTLKNQGYEITHNFGHGQNHLANTLFALNILAFLFHNFLKITSLAFNNLLKKLGKKSDLWRHITVLTHYVVFDSWEHLFCNIAHAWELNDS